MNLRSLNLALKIAWASKWMSLLSVSTVLLGAASITSTMTINHNVELYIDDLVRKFGGPTLRLQLSSESFKNFEYDDLEFIRQHPDVVYVVPERSNEGLSVNYNGRKYDGELKMMEDKIVSVDPLKIISGRSLNALDTDSQNVILSKRMAKRLKIPFVPAGGVLVLARIHDRASPVRVVGIYEIDEAVNFDAGELMVREPLFLALDGQTKMRTLIVRARHLDQLDAMAQFFSVSLVNRFGHSVRIINTKEKTDLIKNDFDSMLLAGYVLGLLALLSGTVGMMNVMLLNVRLRRREIGLYRAMGFSSSRIRSQFLAEFMVISALGSIAGAALGTVFGMALSQMILPPFSEWSELGIVIGVIVTLFIAVGFGLIPASRAVKLDPVEALRT